MSNTTTLAGAPGVPLRKDAGVIALVSVGHLVSHFSQMVLAPLFPLLKDAFGVGYVELGFLLTIFFTVSCVVQALSGFVVDRFGPRPVLFGGLGLLGLAMFGYAASTSYWMLAGCAVLAGVGNGVFHPVDYTLLNRKISAPRLGHAYSAHGITGSLGWALAPAFMVPLALAFSWQVALACAGLLAWAVLALLWFNRNQLALAAAPRAVAAQGQGGEDQKESSLAFLRIPAVWMCLLFFLFYAMVVSAVQTFAPQAAARLHGMPLPWVAMCVTLYMVANSGGMVLGGFLASNPDRCERIVGVGMGLAAGVALVLGLAHLPGLAVPVLFGVMGFAAGIAGPSRDLLVKRSTPANASGRVYGVVYSGLDIGQAVAPLVFGRLMDQGQFRAVLLGLALVQAVLIASAFNVRRARRTAV
ncbi:MAG TPA: MFS transporter [Burkholderiaceae bacterium]